MINALDLLLGREGIPEGFTAALGKRLTPSGGLAYFFYELEREYFFLLREIRTRWTNVTHASTPALEIFRDYKNRAYQSGALGQNAIDLRNIAVPSGVPAATTKIKGSSMPMNMIFPPGSVLYMKVSGIVSSDPAALDLVAIGRYVLKPEGME